MQKIDKTKRELLGELEETKKRVGEIEICRAEFEKAREKYEKLLDSAPDALVFMNEKSRVVLVNAQFEKLFGYSPQEIIGRELTDLVPERFKANHRKKVENFLKHPRIRPMGSDLEIYARKKNGDEFPADISLSPMQTDEELLVTAAIRDITKRKEAEEQIELNYFIQKVTNAMLKVSLEHLSLKEQFNRILDLILNVPYLSLQSKGAIFLKKDDQVLTLKAHHGFSRGDTPPCTEVPVGHCLCGKAAAGAKLLFADHVNGRHEIHNAANFPHGHYCVPIVSGANLYGLLNVYIKQGHKRSNREEEFLASVANTLATIIERHRSEQEKKRLQNQLAQAEKLAALGRFTANVAHEIRNPLTSVGGFARRLDKKIPAGTKEKEYTGIIIAEVSRLESILKNILSFSRDMTPHPAENDIHETTERVLMMNEDLFREKSIKVKRFFSDIPLFFFDKDILIEALENVVLNAVDAMPGGGILTIVTEKDLDAGEPSVHVTVRDTGHGVPKDKLTVIFEPFYTTKVAEHGTGLGLSITRKIMEAMGGSVDVKSEVGIGSEVKLSLPCQEKSR